MARRRIGETSRDSAYSPDTPDYLVVKELGRGGMGVVHCARQTSLDREVALKQHLTGASSEASRRRFMVEAAVIGELDHPNIVPIHDLGENQDGQLFYSMERIRGVPWNLALPENGLERNLDVFLKVCDAVAFAHARRVIHRDIKPHRESLLLSAEARGWLDEAVRECDYAAFQRAVFGYEQAGALRPDNEEAAAGVAEARRAYALAAVDREDLDLATSPLPARDPAFAPLERDIDLLKSRRDNGRPRWRYSSSFAARGASRRARGSARGSSRSRPPSPRAIDRIGARVGLRTAAGAAVQEVPAVPTAAPGTATGWSSTSGRPGPSNRLRCPGPAAASRCC